MKFPPGYREHVDKKLKRALRLKARWGDGYRVGGAYYNVWYDKTLPGGGALLRYERNLLRRGWWLRRLHFGQHESEDTGWEPFKARNPKDAKVKARKWARRKLRPVLELLGDAA